MAGRNLGGRQKWEDSWPINDPFECSAVRAQRWAPRWPCIGGQALLVVSAQLGWLPPFSRVIEHDRARLFPFDRQMLVEAELWTAPVRPRASRGATHHSRAQRQPRRLYVYQGAGKAASRVHLWRQEVHRHRLAREGSARDLWGRAREELGRPLLRTT